MSNRKESAMTGHPQPRRTPAGQNLPYHGGAVSPFSRSRCSCPRAARERRPPRGRVRVGDAPPPQRRPPPPHPPRLPRRPPPRRLRRHDHLRGCAAAEGTFPVTRDRRRRRQVTIEAKPMRIVSTAPASTEILFAIGAGDRVVGVTSLDDYPAGSATSPRSATSRPTLKPSWA